MNQREIIEAENKLCEVYDLLTEWHPEWKIVLAALDQGSRMATVLVRVGRLKYKYVMDLPSVLSQRPETMAWFISQVVKGALTR